MLFSPPSLSLSLCRIKFCFATVLSHILLETRLDVSREILCHDTRLILLKEVDLLKEID